jgi:CspA family cold shock protein
MHRSTVKWFDAKKGYGFITHPDGGEDVFVHYSNIESDDDFKTLHADQKVRFELDDGPKGLHAPTVEPLEDAGSEASAEDGPAPDDVDDDFPESEIDPSEVDPTAEVDPTPSS